MKSIIFLILLFPFNIFAKGNILIETSDNCKISGYEKIFSTNSFILLEIHGLGSNKEEWNKFNTYLEKEKINWLAIDLRGHGESRQCNGKSIDYNNFSLDDWKMITKDIMAGYRHLLEKFPPSKIIFAGASIGANAAMISEIETKIKKIILLSPGLSYAGLNPQNAIESSKQKILILYSLTDKYSFLSVSIFKKSCEEKNIKCFFLEAKEGHGVQIFDKSDGEKFAKEIIYWIKK